MEQWKSIDGLYEVSSYGRVRGLNRYKKLNEINHKDENTSNNNVSNLEWCSRKHNVNYGNHNTKM